MAVLVVLLVAGMPVTPALGFGMMAGCATMVLMASGGGGNGPRAPADHTTGHDARPSAELP